MKTKTIQHTPGPWDIQYGALDENDGGFGVVSHAEAVIVAECYPPNPDLVRRRKLLADAHLISAAPELLAAGKLWLAHYDSCVRAEHLGDEPGIAELRAAVAKAEGRSL